MERLNELFRSNFGCMPESVTPLAGSASNRKYYRMTCGESSCIGVVGTDARENDAFVTIARHLRSKGISVPEVIAVSEDGMAYVQKDLGDVVLFDMLQKARRTGEGMEEVEDILCKVMAELPRIQCVGAEGLDFNVCYPQPSFDMRMVQFDLNYFKYCFLKPSGLEFDEVLLQNDLDRFAQELLEDDSDTFLYRDFNARNVMLKDGQPYFIDFQGGRRGPVYYDVASFIWHARAAYPESLKERMLSVYMESLGKYRHVDETEFRSRLRLFVLFRTLQVLGAYGFRGLVEQKANFVTVIPAAVTSVGEMAAEGFDDYPYLTETLRRMAEIVRFKDNVRSAGRLEVRVQSFSFKKGIPYDPSGNGGGYVFDCRSIHNPGRYEPYKKLTGRDEPVIRFLEEDGEILKYLEHVYGVVDSHVETYSDRGFSSLMVSFGCTGGQHRSVYCAEHLAHHLTEKYPNIAVRLIHREQEIDEYFSPLPSKAMIFAAGLGTRLKPLTDTLPKALVPVCGKPLIEHVLRKIHGAGIHEAVVNVHHFADMVEAWAKDQKWMHIDVSDERALLLETGGAVLRARRFLEGCGSFLIHNVDILSDCDLRQFASQVNPDAVATLLVSNRETSRYFLFDPATMKLAGWMNRKTGEYVMVEDGVKPDSCLPYAFSGIHMMSDRIFGIMDDYIKETGIPADDEVGTRFPVKDFYLWAASRYPIYGVPFANLSLLDVGKLDALAPADEFIRSQE